MRKQPLLHSPASSSFAFHTYSEPNGREGEGGRTDDNNDKLNPEGGIVGWSPVGYLSHEQMTDYEIMARQQLIQLRSRLIIKE